jgi:phosphomannomutase
MVPNNESVIGEIIYDSTLAKRYTDHIISSFSKLKTKMRVIVDPVNSSGSIMAQEFLRGLGCEVIMINDEPIGIFARQAEPNPQALLELGRATLGYAMDIGFGLDPDGDRLALVDENGIPVFEEYTLALCAKAIYEKLEKENVLESAGPFVINLSSSNTSMDVAKQYGIQTKRSKVGEANVVVKMIENNSMFGGEGSGGVIFRPVNFCRDSFVGMALILNLMEETGKKLSVLVDELPKYIMAKEKITGIKDFSIHIPKLKEVFKDGICDESDGLRFDFSDSSWVQIRASNTEPIVRVFTEAKNQNRVNELINLAKKTLSY